VSLVAGSSKLLLHHLLSFPSQELCPLTVYDAAVLLFTLSFNIYNSYG